MQSIFYLPMPAHQLPNFARPCLLRRQARDAIGDLSAYARWLAYLAFNAKDLLNAAPVARKPVTQFRAGGDRAPLQPPMPFVQRRHRVPVRARDRRLLKKEGQVLMECRLVVLGDQHIGAAPACYLLTEPSLSMHRVGADNASVHQGRGEQVVQGTDLVRFVLDDTGCQHDPGRHFIAGQLMDGGLMRSWMAQRPTQRFPIQGQVSFGGAPALKMEPSGFSATAAPG